jgi:hypothetical protein
LFDIGVGGRKRSGRLGEASPPTTGSGVVKEKLPTGDMRGEAGEIDVGTTLSKKRVFLPNEPN